MTPETAKSLEAYNRIHTEINKCMYLAALTQEEREALLEVCEPITRKMAEEVAYQKVLLALYRK